MKLPKTFKPDKNLDDKTNQLVEEANSIPDEEDIEEELLKIITFKEFKELIELRDEHRSNPPGIKTSKNLHEEEEKMMKKAGHNSLRSRKYKSSEKA
ncbi:MAG: hypothetical protein L6408_00545 [Nanoarchaeota archaeon]|nr:hypothetical protein [Nanoarchaeota archaeon]